MKPGQRTGSACEVPPAPGRRGLTEPAVRRFDAARFRWDGVPAIPYKSASDGPMAWHGVDRFVLVGAGDPAAFELRYFEIAPGGYSSFERHRHAHAVLVVRGRGEVRMGGVVHHVGPMDFVFIPPRVPHQFRAGRQRFGFLCPVDARRDSPRPARASRRARGTPDRLQTPRRRTSSASQG